VFGRRSKKDTPAKLWSFINAFRNGETSSDEEELKELVSVARTVGSTLAADNEAGPEEQSRASLIRAIEEEEAARHAGVRSATSGRVWKVVAASGWAVAVLCLSFIMYQSGMRAGKIKAEERAVQNQRVVAEAMIRRVDQMSEELKRVQVALASPDRHGIRGDRASITTTRGKDTGRRAPGAADEEDNKDEEAVTEDLLTSLGAKQVSLMRDGYDRVLRGDWEGAVRKFEAAANVNPDHEMALDAYHAAARVCTGPLDDHTRASEFYQKEIALARVLLARQGPLETGEVRMRLARAYETAGLLGRNRDLLTLAAEESARAETPSEP
jgi:hypothetical protein